MPLDRQQQEEEEETQVEVFEGGSSLLCQGVTFVHCRRLSHPTPWNEAYLLIWIEYLDREREKGEVVTLINTFAAAAHYLGDSTDAEVIWHGRRSSLPHWVSS